MGSPKYAVEASQCIARCCWNLGENTEALLWFGRFLENAHGADQGTCCEGLISLSSCLAESHPERALATLLLARSLATHSLMDGDPFIQRDLLEKEQWLRDRLSSDECARAEHWARTEDLAAQLRRLRAELENCWPGSDARSNGERDPGRDQPQHRPPAERSERPRT